LLDFAEDQSAMVMFDYLLRQIPKGIEDGPLKLGKEFEPKDAAAQSFIGLIRDRMDPGAQKDAQISKG
jgi:hypothetical protein